MSKVSDVLSALFQDYRAEWKQPDFDALFVVPPYFARLEASRPCFLIGGRGTGKTIALKSLRFDAPIHPKGPQMYGGAAKPYFGLYVRINKNRARAFAASELSVEARNKAFAHYFNLLVALELCALAKWLRQSAADRAAAERGTFNVALAAEAFGLARVDSVGEFESSLRGLVARLELYVNNGGRGEAPVFSVAEAPLKTMAQALLDSAQNPAALLFCCIDEYENLTIEQQGVLNTYVKHAEPPLSYKIGLRRNGLHTRATIDQSDPLRTPDDFVEIDISSEGFEGFALEVLSHRLQKAKLAGLSVSEDPAEFLPELSLDREAELLGCERVAAPLRNAVSQEAPDLTTWITGVPDSRLYFLEYWRQSSGERLLDLARDWKNNPNEWGNRIGNHGYASLFWLSRGRRGARIRKYYCGVRTFLALASGNIRYFLELIDESIRAALEDDSLQTDRGLAIDFRAQTDAARLVGKRRLDDLDGLTERGAELKRLVLGIGKVFFEFARNPEGRAPEQTHFVVSGTGDARQRIEELLREGVSHLAFEVAPRTKPTSNLELRDDEYRIHPIYSAFFEISHRKKRRVTFPAETLLRLSTQPQQAISEMLDNREQTAAENLPEQLAMFTDFYFGQ